MPTMTERAIKTARFDGLNDNRILDKVDIEWIDGDTISILPIEDGSGNLLSRITINNRLFKIYDEWTVDKTQNGIDYRTQTGGFIDGIDGTINDQFYMLWAIASEDFEKSNQINYDDVSIKERKFIGYGITKQPRVKTCGISSSISPGSQGNIITTSTNLYESFYQFTVGARILVWYNKDFFNTGTILSIDNYQQMTVVMDNLRHSKTLSNELTYDVVQLNKFRPFIVYKDRQELYSKNFKLLTGSLIISDGEIVEFFREANHVKYNYSAEIGSYTALSRGVSEYLTFKDYVPPTANQVYLHEELMTGAGDYIEAKTYPYNFTSGYHCKLVQFGQDPVTFNDSSFSMFQRDLIYYLTIDLHNIESEDNGLSINFTAISENIF